METTKCEGCGGEHDNAIEVFEDVMGNPICTFCVVEIDYNEFAESY